MQNISKEDVLQRYLNWSQAHANQFGQIHQQILKMRQDSLENLAHLIDQQLGAYQQAGSQGEKGLFELADLQEFASGSIVKCLGEEYKVYTGRRCPRIPNGDLLLMSRITNIQGQKQQFEHESKITAEYDVPADAWYFDGEVDGQLPISVVLEIALQPCGFLSAYLGTSLRSPKIDFFFRNLDGQVMFARSIDSRGKTIITHATLLKTVFSGSTIIQHFAFELICDGTVFFQGRSTFGYFPPETMASQTGLDGGKSALPWVQTNSKDPGLQSLQVEGSKLTNILPKGKLKLLHSVVIHQSGGHHHEGYVYASRSNSAKDWYYACHFYEDPVMPGSLGIEAIIQAMKVFAQRHDFNKPGIKLAVGREFTWKYRGQILQHHNQMQVEIHLHRPEPTTEGTLFVGDANLWADDMRIYEVHNLAITYQEG
jgi:3-hydroxymyristoyl/3-hydroxydecanoyl-(acyl carrier protein) dehydratase